MAQTIDDVPDANGEYGTFTSADKIVSQTRLMAQFEYQQMVFSRHAYYGISALDGNDVYVQGAFENGSLDRANDWIIKRIIYLDPSL